MHHSIVDPSEQYGYRIISSCPPGNIFHKSTELCGKASRFLDIIVSESKGRVYRNEDCALCHGVTAFISGRLITVPVFANVAVFGPQVKPIVTGCNQVYFVASLAIPVHECPSVELSFADMNNAGIANAEMNNLTFSDCIAMKSNDLNLMNISTRLQTKYEHVGLVVSEDKKPRATN
ncbi:hypothetical protein DPMN_173285 [Dreissena polymorpha]|uniref:Uncharacterized protein n=1 Tax=Dreissena polymorpha TaxID=45954 RepID=A0A9D4E3Y7_DREPO|nr:hypothetical protein DPMN_173285 [Dreissena polymorpha]